MRIGLDIATISLLGKVNRILLVTGDTDIIPAMKLAKKHDVQVSLFEIEKEKIGGQIKAHADLIVKRKFPKTLTKYQPKSTS